MQASYQRWLIFNHRYSPTITTASTLYLNVDGKGRHSGFRAFAGEVIPDIDTAVQVGL
jgi:hypothetical protein